MSFGNLSKIVDLSLATWNLIMFEWFLFVVLVGVTGASIIGQRQLRLHELNTFSKAKYIGLGSELLLRLYLGLILLTVFFISPIFAWMYPHVLFLETTFPFGKVYSTIFCIVFVPFLLIFYVLEIFLSKKNPFNTLAKFAERCWLWGLSKDRRKQYDWHGNWRWHLLSIRGRRWRKQARSMISLVKLRWLWMILVSMFALLVLNYLTDGLITHLQKTNSLFNWNKLSEKPQDILLLLSPPIAYTVWLFRDQNNLTQLENQRKDINLKDFQKLAEWAAGLHLPEDKTTETTKSSKTIKPEQTSEASAVTETTNSRESSSAPPHPRLPTPSRRDGAAALQIAAVYQLEAYLRGDFGKHFQRPAFQLLKSIWLALMQPHVTKLNTLTSLQDGSNTKIIVDNWCNEAKASIEHSLGEALTWALAANYGQTLRDHAVDLPNMMLTGLNTRLPALQQPDVALHQAIDLEGLNLRGIQLQGADLWLAQMQGADLFKAHLEGANLALARLQGTKLISARLQGADLNGAQMQGADLSSAQLQGASLLVANLKAANLANAQLQGASLNAALLQGALLLNVAISDKTDFQGAECDGNTRVAVASLKPNTYTWSASTFPNDHIVDEEKSVILRKYLIDRGLKLPS